MKIDIIVPVYRNLDLVRDCLSSLRSHISEISRHEPRVIVIDDSPDDKEVSEYLRKAKQNGIVDVLVANPENLGFVKSVNKGLGLARDRGAAAILVNSDTVTFENTLRELVDVALMDEQFGFVCPRSNNASICTFPQVPHNRAGKTVSPEECHQVWLEVHRHLPRFTLAPTAIGFYMLISAPVVANFGRLDERFGAGYEEENDLVMRAGKVGFRAVLANHSFAFHAGSASFQLSTLDLADHRETNLRTISALHPEFLPLVRKYESSPGFRTERLLSALVTDASGKLDLAFNLMGLAPVSNGTNEFVVSVVKAIDQIGSDRFNVHVLCSREAAEFHGFNKLRNIRIRNSAGGFYAVAFTFGQPYDVHDVNVMEALAPINVYSMLDTISLDCSNLRVEQNIEGLWSHVASTANGLLFISEFSRDTFLRRFRTQAKTFARLLPTSLSAYEARYRDVQASTEHVFIAGNHFSHKDSSRTARELAPRFPSVQFVVMGSAESYPPNVKYLRSGSIDDAHMADILAASSVIVLPSFYEGFGFSLLHALALKKPIVARDIPATREILQQFGRTSGLFLYSSDSELEAALRTAIQAKESAVEDEKGEDWTDWSRKLLRFLDELVDDKAAVYDLLVKRIADGDVLRSLLRLARSGGTSASPPVDLKLKDMTNGTTDEFIRTSYVQVLGREPDPAGLIHHREMLTAGLPREEMLRALLNSAEYKTSGREVRIAGLKSASPRRNSLLSKFLGG